MTVDSNAFQLPPVQLGSSNPLCASGSYSGQNYGYDQHYGGYNSSDSIYNYGYAGGFAGGYNGCYLGDSIYGGYSDSGYYSALGFCGGAYDQTTFQENMRSNQKFYNDFNYQNIHNQRSVEAGTNTSLEAIREAALVLKDKINQNEQDQIIPAYVAYINSVRSAYQNSESEIELSEEELQARANTHYQEITGVHLIQDIRENSHCSFVAGLINATTFGLFDNNCAEDTISQITGQAPGVEEKSMNDSGKMVGNLAMGAALGAAIGTACGGPLVGTVIGLVVGVGKALWDIYA